MRRFAPATVVVAIAMVTAPADTAPKPTDPRAAIAPLARSLIDGEYAGGLVVAVISPAGPPQIFAWGETVRGNGKLPDGNTVFEIGSVSKVFTSLLLAELVIDKQLTLDTPVAKLLPPNAKLPAGKRAITVLDLATHTSGLPRMPDNIHPTDPGNPYADYTALDLFAFLATATLAHEPGTNFQYSNLGVGLLGQALARRGKVDWATLVAAQIARPLAMSSTMVTLSGNARARLAQGYDVDGDTAKPWDLPTLAGAGALRSTALDMAAFVKAEIAASRAPRSRIAKAMALTQTPQRSQGTDESSGKIGLAWLIKPDGTIWHNGETGGYHCLVAFRPARKLGVVVLASGGAAQVDELGFAALAAVTGEPVPATLDLPPPDKVVDENTLETYVGTYDFTPALAITVSRSGAKLYGQVTGQARFRLHATSQREFAVHRAPVTGSFEVDTGGKVTGLVMHQGGVDRRAKRKVGPR
jgi:CubicO group peptidase (beta-lactamase class C family)